MYTFDTIIGLSKAIGRARQPFSSKQRFISIEMQVSQDVFEMHDECFRDVLTLHKIGKIIMHYAEFQRVYEVPK